MEYPDSKAYEITYAGMTAYYAGSTRGRARYLAALTIAEVFGGRVGDALCTMRCRRAPEHDVRALCTLEGAIVHREDYP